MEIRWIKEEEIEKVIELLTESFPVVTTEKRIKENLNEKNRILVAIREEKLVGAILVRKMENFIEDLMSFHLDNVCVKKEFQNNGIASLMLKEVEKIAKCENIDYIDLSASNYREAAHHTYLKNGYEKRDSTIFRRRISDKEF